MATILDTTGTIASGGATVTHTVNNLVAGVPYTIRVIGAGTDPYTLGDPNIQSVEFGSTFIGFNNDGLISGPYGRDAMYTFTPKTAQGGTYTITVTGDFSTTGTYRILLTDHAGGTDNVGENTSTTGVLSAGGEAVTGTIDDAIDVDWYKVSLVAGTTYTFRVRGLASGGGSIPDPAIAGLYNSNGTYITNTYVDDIDTRDALLTYSATYTGDYYIAVDGWSTYTGTFSLDVSASGSDVLSSTSTTAAIPVGGSATVKIEQPYDHDWYAVTLTAGSTYQFTLSGTGYNNTPGIHGIVNAAGTYVVSHANPVLGPGTASVSTIYTPTQNGTYYIDAYSLYEGTYTLSVAQTASDVPASTASVYTVPVNGSVTGEISGATDVDWYKVSLVANTVYAIKMQAQQSGNGTLDDPIISGIYNASGTLIAGTFSDDNDGTDASLVFRPSSSGDYFIAADGYSGLTGTFKLSVTELAADIGDTVATAGSTTTNTPTLVSIDDSADVDWYGVSLTGGTNYVVRLQGLPTKRGTLDDPLLVGIYDNTGTLISNTYVDDVGELRDAKLAFTPSASGTYYIAADGYDRFTGTMKLAVTNDYIGTTNGTAKTIAVAAREEGTIDTVGDVDRYAVVLQPSTLYYFRMLGGHNRWGDLADPNIVGVYNAAGAGQAITAITNAIAVGNDAWAKWTTPAGAATTYYIDTNGGAGDGSFVLTVTTEVANNATTTETVGTAPGSTIGFLEEVSDVDWISATLNTNTSYVIKMRGFDSNNGTLLDPYINGVRHSSNTGVIIAGTTNNNVDTRDALVRLIPTASGVHYIDVQSNGGTSIGSYVVSVETEPGNTTASSWAMPATGSTTGTIDDGTDVDWYSASLNTNVSYLIRMRGVDSGKGTLDNPYINGVYLSTNLVTPVAGTVVDNAVLRESVVRLIPGTAGTYYIVAQSSGSTLGTYTLSVETEAGNTIATAWTLSLDGSLKGTIDDNSDVDYYKIALDNTKSYLFKMKVTGGSGTLSDTVLALRNSSDAVQTAAGTVSNTADYTYRWTPGTSGDYYLEAKGTGANNGTFVLSAEIEPGSTPGTAGSIALGETLSGRIDDNGDWDYYKITLNNTNSYVFKMLVTGGAGTLSDTNLAVRNGADAAQTAAGSLSTTANFSYRWAPTTSGDYYLDARGTGANNGTYRISAEIEGGSNIATAQAITVGQTLNAAIDDNADVDYYQIALSSTSSYVFKMLVTGGVGTLGDTVLAVRNGADAAQTPVASSSTTADYIYRWVPGASGTYYLDARGTGANNGTYRLVAEAEAGNTTSIHGTIAAGQTINAAIDDNADVDYYKISLSNTSSYVFKMIVTGGVGTLGDTSLALRNASDALQTAAGSVSGTADFTYRWSPTTSGDYFLDARGTGANNGTYRLVAETEAGSTTTTAGSVTAGNAVHGAIDDTADTDYYRITLSNTKSYVFRMVVTGGVGTLNDTVVQLRNASDGLETAAATVSTTADFTYRWTPTTSGTYYIEAKGTGSNAGTYRLFTETEAGSTIATAETVALNGTVNATIDDNADTDTYKIELNTGKSYLLKMIVSGGVGTLSDTDMTLRDGANALVTASGTNSSSADYSIRWTPTANGNYYVEAKGTGANSGTYRFVAATETGTLTSNYGTISVGQSVNDTIDDNADTDYYQVALNANTSYVFKMTVSGGAGTLSDTDMTLRDGANAAIAASGTNGSSTDYSIRWTPTSGGNYYLEAKGTGANNGTYRLTAALETGTWTSNHGTLAVGQSVDDTIDDTGDTDYYRITLDNTKSYAFRMVVTGGVGTLSDTNVVVRDLSNNSVAATGFVNSAADYSFRLEPGSSGDYFIEAQGSGANSGTYRLYADIEGGGTRAKALDVAIGTKLDAAIEGTNDIDFYKVSLVNTKSYSFRMVASGTLTDTEIRVHDSSGSLSGAGNLQTATATNATNPSFAFRWKPTASGDYYVEAKPVGAVSGHYQFFAEEDAGGVRTEAMAVAMGSTTSASIDDTADVDFYQVTLNNGLSYLFKMIVTGVDTLTDSVMVLQTAAGATQTPTATNATGADYVIRWTSTAADNTIFYLDARGNASGVGTYNLVAELEAGSTNFSALGVSVGGSVVGNIDDGADTDWWAVELVEGYEYTFKMEAADSNNGTLSDAYINGIRDASGVVQGSTTQDAGTAAGALGDAVITGFRPTASGTYYIQADNGAGSTSATGTYKLSVIQTDPVSTAMEAQGGVTLVGVAAFETNQEAMTLI